MASTPVEKSHNIPPLKTNKFFFLSQISLRILAISTTLAATWIMLSTKETALIFGIHAEARYTYSPAFKFFAYANLVACVFTILSLFLAVFLRDKAVDPTYYFYMFLHDLTITVMLMAGCAAATAVGYVGKYGNKHAGWMAICGFFERFCNRATAASVLSYLAFFVYLMLTVVSANKSRRIQAFES